MSTWKGDKVQYASIENEKKKTPNETKKENEKKTTKIILFIFEWMRQSLHKSVVIDSLLNICLWNISTVIILI